MTSFATDPDGECLSPDFAQRLDQALAALGAQAPVLHLWHAWRQPLDAARDAVLQALRERGHRTHVCAAAEFLPLLQTLNTLIADSLRGAPLPTAQQVGVWVVEDTQALQAPHAALIERILAHFPELPLRLVLLSQTPLAPLWPATAQVLAVDWCEAAPAQPKWTPEEDLPRPRAGHAHLAWGLGAAALLALAAGGGWWALGGAPGGARQQPAAPALEQAAAPASEPALAVAPEAVSEASSAGSEPALSAASAAASSAVPAASLAAPAPMVAASAAASVAAPAAVASAPAAKTAPRSPLQAWVQALPEGSFLVLHGQFANAREAEAFRAADPVLANARTVQAVWTAGQPARYGVLTGPFRSPERVGNYVQRLAWREQARGVSREELLTLLSP